MIKTVNAGTMPTKASKYSAGIDVYANETIMIEARNTKRVKLGVAIDHLALKKLITQTKTDKQTAQKLYEEFLELHYISLKPRSSLRVKGIISHSAVIDLDYKDEIEMILHNPASKVFTINKGDKIGQLLLLEHSGYFFGIKSEEDRKGGFGSSGA